MTQPACNAEITRQLAEKTGFDLESVRELECKIRSGAGSLRYEIGAMLDAPPSLSTIKAKSSSLVGTIGMPSKTAMKIGVLAIGGVVLALYVSPLVAAAVVILLFCLLLWKSGDEAERWINDMLSQIKAEKFFDL